MFNLQSNSEPDILKYALEDLPFILKDNVGNVETYSILANIDEKVCNFIKACSRNIKLKQLIDNTKEDDLNIFEKDVIQHASYLESNKKSNNDFTQIYYFEKKINWNTISYSEPCYAPDVYMNDFLLRNLVHFIRTEILKIYTNDIIIYSEMNKQYTQNDYNISDISLLLNLLNNDTYSSAINEKHIIIPNQIIRKYNIVINEDKKNTNCIIYYMDIDINKIIICNYKPNIYCNYVQYIDVNMKAKNYFRFGITYPNIMPFLDYILF